MQYKFKIYLTCVKNVLILSYNSVNRNLYSRHYFWESGILLNTWFLFDITINSYLFNAVLQLWTFDLFSFIYFFLPSTMMHFIWSSTQELLIESSIAQKMTHEIEKASWYYVSTRQIYLKFPFCFIAESSQFELSEFAESKSSTRCNCLYKLYTNHDLWFIKNSPFSDFQIGRSFFLTLFHQMFH